MLNASPRHTSGAHVRSPRGGRERGSSVPIMDAETRRRVDPFPGLGNPNPLWVQGLAQGSQPVYGPVPRGRTPARSPHGVATGAPQQTMGGPSFPPGLPQQAVGSPSLPPGLSTGPPQPVVTPSQTSPDVQGLTRQVRELESMMQQLVVQQQQFMQTMTSSMVQQQQQHQQWMIQQHQQQQPQQQQQVNPPLPQDGVPENMPSSSSGCQGASPVGTPAKGTQLFRMASPSPPLRPPPLEQERERDVFARSDKWLPSLPTIDFSSWKDRISEALGFLTWMEKLTSWVGLGSEVFPNELMHAVKTQEGLG